MNPKRRRTPAQTAIAAVAAVVALGLMILTLSRPQGGQDLQSAAAALATRADSTNAVSPRELLSVLRQAAPTGDEIRLLTTDGRSIGRPLKVGEWSTSVYPLRGHPGLAAIELRQPGIDGGGQGFMRDAAIVAGLVILLGLMAASGASARAAAMREAHVGRDRNRPQVPDLEVPAVPPAHSDRDRRLLVGALLVVIETLPDSPAGARALRTLKQVGVETIEPTHGVAFDSRLHCVCGVVEAPEPSLVDSVAAVIRPGFIDHGMVLREADVQIYGSTRERTQAVPAVS
jgi:GrpE